MRPRQVFMGGVLVYLLLIPFFFHPDLKIIYYLTQFLTQGVGNIYHYITTHPEKANLGPFVYPPIAYLFFGLLHPVIRLLAGSAWLAWLGMGNDAVGVAEIYRYQFLMKLPLVGIHALSAWVLLKLVADEKKQSLIQWLWWFNPISIYAVAFMGQIDGVAVLLTLMALYWASKKPTWAAMALGLGAAFKTYPLVFLPFLVWLAGKTFWHRLKLLSIGLGLYLLSLSPFLLTPAFYKHTLVSGLTQRLFMAGLDIGFGEKILWVPLALGLVFLHALSRSAGQAGKLANYFLASSLLLVSGIHFHPHWALWATPFVCLYFAHRKNLWPVMLFVGGWLGVVLTFPDRFLSWGLAGPLDPGLFLVPALASVLPLSASMLAANLSHTLIMLAGLWMIYDQI